jgi:hypothetical protein
MIRTRESFAKDFDGAPIGIGSRLEVTGEGEVVLKGEVNHTV